MQFRILPRRHAQHIALYVNAHSLDIGDDGMRAIARLVSDAR